LGNVLSVISDNKQPIQSTIHTGEVGYFVAVQLAVNDYYPFGSEMIARTFNSKEYRFGFNGQEKTDEIDGGSGDHNTAQFWEYDTRIGRRWNLDPKPNPSFSEYGCFADNPIYFSDADGDTVRGMSATSAKRELDNIDQSFQGDKFKDLRKLFKLGDDGKTFQPISEADFDKATSGLSDDEKALATGYYKVINDKSLHKVSCITRDQTIGSENADVLNSGKYDGIQNKTDGTAFKSTDKGSDFDDATGGGTCRKTDYGDLTIIVMNSSVKIGDYVNTKTGEAVTNYTSSPRELSAHELLGHGLGRSLDSKTWGHEDAIQLTNLYLRVRGVNSRYRNGTSHGSRVELDKDKATSIPSYLKK